MKVSPPVLLLTGLLLLDAHAPMSAQTPARPASAQPTDAARVRGGERLGWQQEASSLSAAGPHRFRLYIDGVLAPFEEVRCVPGSQARIFECSGRLPPMRPGRHVLELSIVVAGTESRRAPIAVVFEGSEPALRATVSPGQRHPTAPLCVDDASECYDVHTVAATERIDAVGVAPDGRVAFLEGGRQVRIVASGRLVPKPALGAAGSARLVSLALGADFSTTRNVFVGVIQRHRDGRREYVIKRYKESGNVLRDGVTILEPVAVPDLDRVPVAVDPQGRLYIAVPGRILRLEAAASGRGGAVAAKQIAEGPDQPIALVWLASREGLLLGGSHKGRNMAAVIAPDGQPTPSDGSDRRLAASWSNGRIRCLAVVRGAEGRVGVLLATTAGVYRNFGDTKATLERFRLESLGVIEAAAQDAAGGLFLAVGDAASGNGKVSLVYLRPRR